MLHDSKGHRVLMPIGGAEDKRAQCLILRRFTALSGGSSARIVVLPAASAYARETGSNYCTLFTELGAAQVECLHIDNRTQANDPARAAVLKQATGIFLTGGDQLKLVALIGATRMEDGLLQRSAEGVPVAGTSAGASAMSQQMIAFGRSGSQPRQRMVQLAAGLGLTKNLIIDQHFTQRDRLGRLTTAVALNPRLLGIGIDEDTACLITPDGCIEVLGSGAVTVVDGQGLIYSDIYMAKGHSPFTVGGVNVSILEHGMSYASA